jgi:hypothetical protein
MTKCAKCGNSYSDNVFPLHVPRCPGKVEKVKVKETNNDDFDREGAIKLVCELTGDYPSQVKRYSDKKLKELIDG